MDLTTKAIAADNRCEIAYLHLAQMFAQSGRLAEAMGTYTRAIDLSRSASDAEAACLGMQAVRAQMAAMQRLGPVMGVPAEAMAEANAAAAATAAAAAESSVAAAGAQ